MSSRQIALISIVTASLFWATAGVVAKILLKTFTPFSLAFVRFALASLFILPFFIKEKNKSFSKILFEVLPVALLSVGNIFFFYVGLQRTTANASAIIYTLMPLIVAIFARIVLKETLTSKKLAGIILGFLGALTIVVLPIIEKGLPDGQQVSGDFIGNLYIFVATCTWSFYTIGSRKLVNVKHYSPLTVSAVSIFASALVFFVLTFFMKQTPSLPTILVPTHFLLIVHLAVIVTVCTYLLYQWALKHTTAAVVSLTVYIQPVFGILLAIIFLGEKLTLGFVFGSLLVFAGVFLATGTQVKQTLSQTRFFKR